MGDLSGAKMASSLEEPQPAPPPAGSAATVVSSGLPPPLLTAPPPPPLMSAAQLSPHNRAGAFWQSQPGGYGHSSANFSPYYGPGNFPSYYSPGNFQAYGYGSPTGPSAYGPYPPFNGHPGYMNPPTRAEWANQSQPDTDSSGSSGPSYREKMEEFMRFADGATNLLGAAQSMTFSLGGLVTAASYFWPGVKFNRKPGPVKPIPGLIAIMGSTSLMLGCGVLAGVAGTYFVLRNRQPIAMPTNGGGPRGEDSMASIGYEASAPTKSEEVFAAAIAEAKGQGQETVMSVGDGGGGNTGLQIVGRARCHFKARTSLEMSLREGQLLRIAPPDLQPPVESGWLLAAPMEPQDGEGEEERSTSPGHCYVPAQYVEIVS